MTLPDRVQPRDLWFSAGLLLLVAAIYYQALSFGFISWDDPEYVTDNAAVRQGLTLANLVWAFTAFHAANWHPLTWLSHMLDVSLFGMDARGHHATSVLLHAANTLLLYAFLVRATGQRWRAVVVAALFAIHPLHVESVAWISERKDLLSTAFWLLTLHAYLGYVRHPTTTRYLATTACLVLGLMAKPMLVTLPCVMLLLDFWPLRRFGAQADPSPTAMESLRWLLLEKLPWFALVVAASAITLLAQRAATAKSELVTLADRLANALISYAAYLGKMLYPADLSYFYPFREAWNAYMLAAAVVLLAALSAAAWRLRKRRPEFLVGWLWYLGTLVPVIGVVQVGGQAMADRYTYIPLIGVFICVAWALPDLQKSPRWRLGIGIFGLATAGLLATAAHGYAAKWRSSFDLYRHALSHAPENFHAHTMLADQYAKQGKLDLARKHAQESLELGRKHRLASTVGSIANNLIVLGNIELAGGDPARAAENYRRAAELVPNDPLARFNLGRALRDGGQHVQAIAAFEDAIRLDPAYAGAHNQLGFSLLMTGDRERAIRHYQEAIRLRPEYPEAYFNLAVALELQGRTDDAIVSYGKSLALNPGHVVNHLRLANLLIVRGRSAEAAQHVAEALRLSPGNPAALNLQKGLKTE